MKRYPFLLVLPYSDYLVYFNSFEEFLDMIDEPFSPSYDVPPPDFNEFMLFDMR